MSFEARVHTACGAAPLQAHCLSELCAGVNAAKPPSVVVLHRRSLLQAGDFSAPVAVMSKLLLTNKTSDDKQAASHALASKPPLRLMTAIL